jgi:polar amino acid transport system permease protein
VFDWLGGWYSDSMRIDQLIDTFFNVPVWRTAFPNLLSGLKITLLLASVTLLLAMAVGLLVAVIRTTRIRLLGWLITMYVDAFRAWPPLVLLIVFYFALPFVGVRFTPYTAAILVLTLLNGAFISEVFRSGIEGVDRGQIEAARALGLTARQTMLFVIIPQALKIVLPPLTSNAIALLKDTALVSVIAVPELLREARMVQSVYLNPSPLMAASLIYLAVLVPLVRLVSVLERWATKSG